MFRLLLAAIVLVAPLVASAQDQVPSDLVMQAVRAALAPAMPFPASDELGSLPADGRSGERWMIRPHQSGDRTIEILANPLNEEYQKQAAKAMAEIELSIEAAQRRAEVQYERAIAEAKRTRRSQDVDGVTLSDEGLAGARIDAESHVTIDVSLTQPAAASVSMQTTPSSVFRGDDGIERFREGQSTVLVGSLVIRLRGSETLIAELLRRGNWAELLELPQ